jgi:transposase-like protein
MTATSDPVIKKGTIGKGAQQYRCKECKTYFNDLTETFFEHRKFPIEEMFYMIKEMRSVPTAQIASELNRDYEAVLNFRYDLQELCGELDELTLTDVCEADEIYVTAGEKGKEKADESPRSRGLKKSEEASSRTNRQS